MGSISSFQIQGNGIVTELCKSDWWLDLMILIPSKRNIVIYSSAYSSFTLTNRWRFSLIFQLQKLFGKWKSYLSSFPTGVEVSKDVLLFTFLLLYQNISDGFVHFIIQVSVGSHLITSFTSFDILSFLNSSSSNVARQELCYNSNTLLSNCDHIRVNVFVYEMAQESAVGKKKKKK